MCISWRKLRGRKRVQRHLMYRLKSKPLRGCICKICVTYWNNRNPSPLVMSGWKRAPDLAEREKQGGLGSVNPPALLLPCCRASLAWSRSIKRCLGGSEAGGFSQSLQAPADFKMCVNSWYCKSFVIHSRWCKALLRSCKLLPCICIVWSMGTHTTSLRLVSITHLVLHSHFSCLNGAVCCSTLCDRTYFFLWPADLGSKVTACWTSKPWFFLSSPLIIQNSSQTYLRHDLNFDCQFD